MELCLGSSQFWYKRCIALGLTLTLSSIVHSQTVLLDPFGDASGHHDIKSISGGYSADTLYLSADFYPGTLVRSNLGFIFGLDTDENIHTGVQPPASFPLGADYAIFFDSIADSANAKVRGTNIPVQFGIDSLRLSVPLGLLGNDDGRMRFGLIVGVPTSGSSFTGFDLAPDSARNSNLGGPTSPIPEPSSGAMMLLAALVSVFVRKKLHGT